MSEAAKGVWVGEVYYTDPPSEESVDLQTVIERGIAASLGGCLKPAVSAEAERAAADFLTVYRQAVAAADETESKLVEVHLLMQLIAQLAGERVGADTVAKLIAQALAGESIAQAAGKVMRRLTEPV